MAIKKSLYSCATDEWPAPQAFFDALEAEFHFTLDPYANAKNYKCPRYFTRQDDGLAQDWGHELVFCNPPYGRTKCAWARKCCETSRAGATVVLLAHTRTDTRWIHDWGIRQGKRDSICPRPIEVR